MNSEVELPTDNSQILNMIRTAEESFGLIFANFIESANSVFTDHHTKETVPCTSCLISFWHLQAQQYVQAGVIVLHGTFSIASANYCSGWLVFENADFPEVRFLRYANQATVFDGVYNRSQLQWMQTTDF